MTSFTFWGMGFYFFAIMFQLFIYCWHGNEIEIESLNVSNAVYECNWLVMENDSKKMLIQMMNRAQKPLRFSAGKFAYLTVETFTTVSSKK